MQFQLFSFYFLKDNFFAVSVVYEVFDKYLINRFCSVLGEIVVSFLVCNLFLMWRMGNLQFLRSDPFNPPPPKKTTTTTKKTDRTSA